jgi:hypothetical protein
VHEPGSPRDVFDVLGVHNSVASRTLWRHGPGSGARTDRPLEGDFEMIRSPSLLALLTAGRLRRRWRTGYAVNTNIGVGARHGVSARRRPA